MEFTHGNAEKLKFCFLKNRKEQLRTPCLAYHCNENRCVRHACRRSRARKRTRRMRSEALWRNGGNVLGRGYKWPQEQSQAFAVHRARPNQNNGKVAEKILLAWWLQAQRVFTKSYH